MPPLAAVAAAVAAAATTVIGAIGSVLGAISAFSIGGFAIGNALLQVGLNLALNALFAPKKASVGQRQASILEIELGEGPRRAMIGLSATAGALVNAWTDGSSNEYETQIIRLSDTWIDGLVEFYNDDKGPYPFTADGAVNHADFKDGSTSYLWMEFRDGRPGQTVAPIITNQGVAAGEYTAPELAAGGSFKGIAYVVVRYKVSDKVWKNGRPKFRFVCRGTRVYDPRLDSTVAGGSGPQRWGDPTTYAYSTNARVLHFNYMRGFWNYAASPAQLMVGPGRTADECPPEQGIADANLCDEAVTLKNGGTEPRYRAAGTIFANEQWADVEEHFAAAMGGQLVERGGTVGADPGAARSAVFEFTDDDFLVEGEIAYQGKVSRDKLVNTITTRYVDPTNLWEEATSPPRRSQDDIDADGEVREQSYDLVLVTSGTQAQRIGEIYRRRARLQPSAVVPLGPAFMQMEEGDVCGWTSARRFGGERREFEVQGVDHDDNCNVQAALKQYASSIFTWNPAVDELDPKNPAYLPGGALAAASIEDFAAAPIEITDGVGLSTGGIRATWTPPADVTITGLRLEYRPKGSPASLSITVPPGTGEYVIGVLPVVDVDYEIRAVPQVSPTRDVLATAWRDVLLSVPFNAPLPPQNFVGYQTNDLIRFTLTAFSDTTLQYEIRAGETFELGRFVARFYGGASTVTWPIASTDDDVLFWCKTLHRSGVYSTQAALWVAAPNIANTNYILSEDYQAEDFPGVWHWFSDTYVGDTIVLELDQQPDESVTRTTGDYYTKVTLGGVFKARTWLEYRASAYVDDLPAWDDTDDTWDDFGDADWQPSIGDAGGDASLDPYIAVNTTLPDSLVEGWRFNGSTTGVRTSTPSASSGVTYAPAKIDDGVSVSGSLTYDVTLPAACSALFDYRLPAKPIADHVIVELTDDDGQFLRFVWRVDDETFALEGNYAPDCVFPIPWEEGDTISVGIWQSATARGAVAASKLNPSPISASTELI